MKLKTQNLKLKTTIQISKLFKLILAIFTLSTFYFLLSTSHAFAQASDIGYARLTPASPLYFLKAGKEGLEVKLAKTPLSKLALHLDFSYRRLREARTLISQREDLVQPTLERYLAEINSLPDKFQEEDKLGLKVKESLIVHSKVLEEIHELVSSVEARRSVRYVISRIIQRSDLTSESKYTLCRFLEKQSKSSDQNDVEKAVLTKRAKSCFNGLSQ